MSLIGHSLGSAIMFDILCRQKESTKQQSWGTGGGRHSKHRQATASKSQHKGLEFEFDVEDFYCLGSPIGKCSSLHVSLLDKRRLVSLY